MNTLTAVVNNVVILTEKTIQVKLGKNWFNIVEPDLTFWQGSLNRTVQVSFKELEQIHTEMFLNVISVRQVKMLKSNELTVLVGTVTKVSLIPNHDNAINIEIGGITVGAARIPLLNVVGVPVSVSLTDIEGLAAVRYYWVKLRPRTSLVGRVCLNLKDIIRRGFITIKQESLDIWDSWTKPYPDH